MKVLSTYARTLLFLLLLAAGMAMAPATAGETGHGAAGVASAERHAVVPSDRHWHAGEAFAPCDRNQCVASSAACCVTGACGSAFGLSAVPPSSELGLLSRQVRPGMPIVGMQGIFLEVAHGPPRLRA